MLRATVVTTVITAVLGLSACGTADAPPATGAARLVPSGALVYLHLSTDTSRDAVQRAGSLAAQFPGYPGLRNSLVRQLSASGQPVDERHDVRPWLGREAALALIDSGGRTANSLILLDVKDRPRARTFLARAGARSTPAASPYRGVPLIPYGSVQAAFVGHYLALGQPVSLRAAIDLAAGHGRSLASNPTYRSATDGLPAGRVADGYLTVDGIRRLLVPRGGLLGTFATLLNQPALRAAGLALSAVDGGARLRVVNVLDQALTPSGSRRRPLALTGSGATPLSPFSPTLDSEVPGNAVAYLGVGGLGRALGGLASAAGSAPTGIGDLVARVRTLIASRANASLGRQLGALFAGEVALWIAPHVPIPALAVIAHAPDEASTRLAMAQLQAPLAQLFAPPTKGGGVAPVFTPSRVAGVDAYSLRLTPALELDYAVFAHKLVIATSLDAIAAARQNRKPLSHNQALQALSSEHHGPVTSLVFVDLGQLLRLAELTGLDQSRTYLAIRDDLKKISAVGESSSAGHGKTIADLFFKIP
jgi:hypothetical protein